MTTINLDDLSQEILDKIPLSLQIEGPILNIEDLPQDIQYLIQYELTDTESTVVYNTIYDLKPELSIYNDFQTIPTKRELIEHYFRNYLQVKTGNYPFDVNEGTRLKEHLQTKDISLQRTLISNDINKAKRVLGEDYDIGVEILDVSIIPVSLPISGNDVYTDVRANIQLKIEGEDETIDITAGH